MQIPLRRGHPAALYKGNHSEIRPLTPGQRLIERSTLHTHRRVYTVETTEFRLPTRAGCQRPDWNSGQLSPTLGGGAGSDIKRCIHSGLTATKCVITSLSGQSRTAAEIVVCEIFRSRDGHQKGGGGGRGTKTEISKTKWKDSGRSSANFGILSHRTHV